MKLGKHSRISKPRRLLIEMEKPAGTALLTASLVVTMSGVPLSAFAQGSSAETDAETAAQLEASSDDAADAAGEDEASSSEPGSNTGATADEGAGQPSKDGQSGEDAEQPAENENTGEQGSGSEENPGQGSEQGEDSQKGQGVSDHQNPGAEENGSENKGSEGEKTEGESSQEEQVPSEVKPAVEESKEEVKPVSEVEFAAAVESVMRQSSSLSATQTELAVAKRLLEAGWTPEMAAAAVGNMYAESGSNAASFANMSGMFNYAYEVAGGIFQWTDAGSSHASL